MNILDFADVIDENIIITYHPNQQRRFTASFEGCETKDGIFLKGDYGNGKSPTDAINNYTSKIIGKTIVFGAMRSDTQEYKVPTNIELL